MQSGIESAVAELKAALARDPEGFTKDAKAKEILDRLNDEIARVYGEGDEDGSEYDDEEEEDDEEGSYYSDEDEDDYDDGEDGDADGRGSETGSKDRGEAKTELPKGPRPYDLWRAAHEVERPAKQVRCAAVQAGWLRPNESRWTVATPHHDGQLRRAPALPTLFFSSLLFSAYYRCSAWC